MLYNRHENSAIVVDHIDAARSYRVVSVTILLVSFYIESLAFDIFPNGIDAPVEFVEDNSRRDVPVRGWQGRPLLFEKYLVEYKTVAGIGSSNV